MSSIVGTDSASLAQGLFPDAGGRHFLQDHGVWLKAEHNDYTVRVLGLQSGLWKTKGQPATIRLSPGRSGNGHAAIPIL